MKLVKIVTVLSLLVSASAFAEGGHSHGPGGHSHGAAAAVLTEDQAKEKSRAELARLVKATKLETSWNQAVFSAIEKKDVSGKQEWMVTYKNSAAAEKAKTELFVFLDLSGKFIAANHSGK